ncbi:MAG: LPS assembly lipoprotein LptE [Pseudomonadales bacterium]
MAKVRCCLQPWLLGALLALVVGCGFQLRGWHIDDSVSAVFIAGADSTTDARTELGSDLRTAFGQAGVTVAKTRGEADLVVTLLDQRRQRRSVSVTGQARAAEYELSRGVFFSVDQIHDETAEILIEPRWIEVERIYRVDRNNIVGSNEEQALVERDLKNDIIQQIVRSINLVLTQKSTVAAQTP